MPSGSAVDAETTIERLQSRQESGLGVFVICGDEIVDNNGEKHYEIHRKGQNTTKETAQKFADRFSQLAKLARHVVRDLDPQDELEFFRVKAKKQEILIAPKYNNDGESKYHIIGVQDLPQPSN